MLPVALVVASIFVFLAACVCLLVPGMRLKSVAIWAVSVVLFWVGSVLLDRPAPTREAIPPVSVQAQRQPSEPEPGPGWTVDESQGFMIATGVGDEGIVTVAVSCQGSTPAVLVGLDGGFGSGLVQAVWSDGTVDQYAFEVSGPYLTGLVSNEVSRELLRKLRTVERSVALTVQGVGRRFTDIIGLDGSTAAIDSLPCA